VLKKTANMTDQARNIAKTEIIDTVMNKPAVKDSDDKKGDYLFEEYGPGALGHGRLLHGLREQLPADRIPPGPPAPADDKRVAHHQQPDRGHDCLWS
jgi:hypothetical protein